MADQYPEENSSNSTMSQNSQMLDLTIVSVKVKNLTKKIMVQMIRSQRTTILSFT